jgi:hypothetical protein
VCSDSHPAGFRDLSSGAQDQSKSVANEYKNQTWLQPEQTGRIAAVIVGTSLSWSEWRQIPEISVGARFPLSKATQGIHITVGRDNARLHRRC